MSSLWLNEFRHNIYSQNGEDGVLQAIFAKIGTTNRWCCELGAGDGLEFSNTANLTRQDGGWKGVLIEADANRFDQLVANMGAFQMNCTLLHRYIGLNLNRLDDVLNETTMPQNFDLLSIDIDGQDIHIWEDLREHRPRVVVIEVDSCCAPGAGSSARGMATLEEAVTLGKDKRYELALHTGNAIFVTDEACDLLGVDRDNWQELFDRRWLA